MRIRLHKYIVTHDIRGLIFILLYHAYLLDAERTSIINHITFLYTLYEILTNKL